MRQHEAACSSMRQQRGKRRESRWLGPPPRAELLTQRAAVAKTAAVAKCSGLGPTVSGGATAFPPISSHFPPFPGMSCPFPGVSRRFPGSLVHFWPFLAISGHFDVFRAALACFHLPKVPILLISGPVLPISSISCLFRLPFSFVFELVGGSTPPRAASLSHV